MCKEQEKKESEEVFFCYVLCELRNEEKRDSLTHTTHSLSFLFLHENACVLTKTKRSRRQITEEREENAKLKSAADQFERRLDEMTKMMARKEQELHDARLFVLCVSLE